MRRWRFLLTAHYGLALAVSSAMLAAAQPDPPRQRLRISTPRAGVYGVDFEQLRAAGLAGPVPSAQLGLSQGGEPVPLWIADGDDGVFGPRDRLEFVARHLPGEGTYNHSYSPTNVYWLDTGAGGPRYAESEPPAPAEGRLATLVRDWHLEEDRLMTRPRPEEILDGRPPDLWYWTKLTHLDREPYVVPLDLSGLLASHRQPLRLRVGLRGLSTRPSATQGEADPPADHEVALALAGRPLASFEWSGRSAYAADSSLALPHLETTQAELSLRVPRRRDDGHDLIDVVMLDWIAASYPHDGRLRPGQVELRPLDDGAIIELSGVDRALRPVLYTDRGMRLQPSPVAAGPVAAGPAEAGAVTYRISRHAVDQGFWLVTDEALIEPLAVELDEPSDLRGVDYAVDYLVVSHGSLLPEADRLAEAHRRHGLSVLVADVADAYDELNHGIPHPIAIRELVRSVRDAVSPPTLRFVLLLGDASWDTHNALADDSLYANWSARQLVAGGRRFSGRDLPTYRGEEAPNTRNLIPSVGYPTYEGLAASDDWYVSLDRSDGEPELAIGRLPVAEIAEAAAIVDKTVAALDDPVVGPARRQQLWITNENPFLQNLSDAAAAGLGARGFVPSKVYPRIGEPNNSAHVASLLDRLSVGGALVHFVGHGGRFIWRTGPPDPLKNHDLLRLEDLERLAATRHLPVVLSLACHTAPFDHPTADSIGEKLLRLPDRGALAVIGASWRTVAYAPFTQELTARLSTPGTIGEALMQAKQVVARRIITGLYNLLGDPALSAPVPALAVNLESLFARGETTVTARLDRPTFEGQVIASWMDAEGRIVAEERRSVTSPQATFDAPKVPNRWVSVYFWDEENGVDGLGGLDLAPAAAADWASAPVAGSR